MTENTKLTTVVKVMSGISLGTALAKDAKMRYDNHVLHSATVESKAYVYPSLMEYLTLRTKTKSIKFSSSHSGIKRLYNGSGKAVVNINGNLLKVTIERPDAVKLTEDIDTYSDEALIFTSRTRAGIEALQALLEELTEKRRTQTRDPYLYTPTNYGWEGKKFAYRNIDSVILPEGMKEDLVNDLEMFFGNEKHFERIGVPWHRGYLFHGPPGNGKSSIAAAIAHNYRLHLYNMPLSGVKDDKALADNISRIQDNSVLLLEDIDIFSNSMGRTQHEKGPTLAGLLNALDGVATPHGLITFMTTNHVENLDPALIRPGRIDKRVELNAPTRYQMETLFQYAYEQPLGVEPKAFESMAEFSNVLKMFTLDAEAARMEIKSSD